MKGNVATAGAALYRCPVTKTSPSGPPPALADFLKAKTWALHAEAEKSGIVADIIRQRVAMADYLNFLQNLIEIYTALEQETSWLERYNSLQAFFTPQLFRRAHLTHDYETLLSHHPDITRRKIHPVTRAYCDHITRSQNIMSSAMLAHLYVRYLGDLNGGQVLRRLLRSSLGLTDECLTFYTFVDIQDIQHFRCGFRAALNEIILTEPAQDAASRAAMEAFRFNITLSAACQTNS